MHHNVTRWLAITTLAGAMVLTCNVYALPDDKQKPIEVENPSGNATLKGEDVTLHGTPEQPARITQGTMQISGVEIHIDRENGVVQSITASGNPAHFQQQPTVNEAIVHVSGDTMKLDNARQMISVDSNAEYHQDGNSMKAPHLDYNMETGQANATGGVQMIIQPQSSRENTSP